MARANRAADISVGLVLSSGQLRGAPYVGLWAFLRDQGWAPNVRIIHGASIGAQVGAALAVTPQEPERIAKQFVDAGARARRYRMRYGVFKTWPRSEEQIRTNFIQNHCVVHVGSEVTLRRALKQVELNVGVATATLTRAVARDINEQYDYRRTPKTFISPGALTFWMKDHFRPRLISLHSVRRGTVLRWILGSSAALDAYCAAPIIEREVVADGCMFRESRLPIFDIDNRGLDLVVVANASDVSLARRRLRTPSALFQFNNSLDLESQWGSSPPLVCEQLLLGYQAGAKAFARRAKGARGGVWSEFRAGRAERGIGRWRSFLSTLGSES